MTIHISASSINLLADSRRKYVGKLLGIDETQQDYFDYGKGIHYALESFVKTGSVDWDGVDAMTSDLGFDGNARENYVFSIEGYIHNQFPQTPNPASIITEQYIASPIDASYELVGYIDAIHKESHIIVDYKTTSQLKKDAPDARKLQAFVYAVLYKMRYSKSANKVVFSQIGKKFAPTVADYKTYIELHQSDTILPSRVKKSDLEVCIQDKIGFKQRRYMQGKHIQDVEIVFSDNDIQRGNERIQRFIQEDFKIRNELLQKHKIDLFA